MSLGTHRLQRIAETVDGLNEGIGRAIAWLTLAMVLVQFAVVVLRYGLSTGSIALQESVTYLNALVFMLGAAYTLKRQGHVRVDVFYRRLSARARAAVDLAGTLALLLPMTLFILVSSWNFVANSWRLMEGSPEAGGLPLVFALKGVILVMPVLLVLQGIAMAIRSLLVLRGLAPPRAAPADSPSP